MLKILHTADWHARDLDYDEVAKCLGHMAIKAVGLRPDLIIIAGDLTDSQELKMESRSAKLIFQTVSDLAAIAPVVICTGTPSHDGNSPQLFQYLDNVWVSDRPEQLYLSDSRTVISDDGRAPVSAVISVMPAVTKQYFEIDGSIENGDAEIGRQMTQIFQGFGAMTAGYPGIPHILVGHWNVAGSYVSETQILIGREIEVDKTQVTHALADVVCLGHIHKQQRIGQNIFYSGSIYRKDFGELDPKGFYLHNVDAGMIESRFFEVPTRKLVKLKADLTDQEFDASGLELITKDVVDAIVRYEIKVFTDDARRINQAELKRTIENLGAEKVDIQLHRIPRETIRCRQILETESLADKVELMAETRHEELSPGIIDKARRLETESADDIMQSLLAKADLPN